MNGPNHEQRVLSDRPTVADRFGFRDALIPRLVGVTLKWPGSEGLVIGLYGEWGSGKSSALAMYQADVDASENAKVVKERRIRVESFRAWAYEDTGALITSFFATVASALELAPGKRMAEAAGALRKMGRFLTVASKGLSVAGVSYDLDKLGEALEAATEETAGLAESLAGIADMAAGGDQRLAKHRATVEKALAKLGEEAGRVVILVDDVDRMDRRELLSLFRLVRTVADLPAVTIVLAMDDRRVREVLGEARGEGYGQDYLDKIVQVAVPIPPPERWMMENELDRVFTSTLPGGAVPAGLQRRPEGRFGHQRAPRDVLVDLIATPRDLVRYTNSLRVLFTGEDPDVDLFDACLIEALHVFYPDVYERVRAARSFLTGEGQMDRLVEEMIPEVKKKAEAERATRLEWIVNGDGIKPRYFLDDRNIRLVLRELFGDAAGQRSRDGADFHARRIRHPDTFSHYFRFAPPTGRVRREEIQLHVTALDQAAESDDPTQLVLAVHSLYDKRSDEEAHQILEGVISGISGLNTPAQERLGDRLLNIVEELDGAVATRLLGAILEARWAPPRGAHPGHWMMETYGPAAENKVAEWLRAALSRPFTLLALYVMVSGHLRRVDLGTRTEILQEILRRFVSDFATGDPFDDPYVGSARPILIEIRRWIQDLGDESPTSAEQLQNGLSAYIERRPDRLVAVLEAEGETREAWGVLKGLFGSADAAVEAVNHARAAGVLGRWDGILSQNTQTDAASGTTYVEGDFDDD